MKIKHELVELLKEAPTICLAAFLFWAFVLIALFEL